MINITGVALGAFAFVAILSILYFIEGKLNKNKITNLDERLYKTDQEIKKEEEKKLIFLDKLELDLKEAEIKMGLLPFCILMSIGTIMLYFLSYSMFKKPLIGLAPVPFSLYFVPYMIIDGKKHKVMKKFDDELIVVLRRMSAILQTGSVLQALEDVKNLSQISPKMRIMLNKVHHNYKYGDSIEEAFYKATKQIKSENLMIAAISIDLNKELGADLGNSLNELSKRIQKKQIMSKKADSLMASTVMIGKVLSFVPFLLLGYISYSDPTYFDCYLSKTTNQIVFMGMILMMFIGIYVINKNSKNKVR